jgi:hypothetical protein
MVSALALIVEMPFTSESFFVKKGHKTPAHQHQLTLARLLGAADDRLKSRRGDVEVPVRQDQVEGDFAKTVSFGDSLFI